MKKILSALLLMIVAMPYTAAAEEASAPLVIGGFNNGLGYTEQMKENWDRGTKEIADSPQRIDPSFKEEEITKLGVPFLPQADWGEGVILAIINVGDSLCRGTWRILVAPFPVLQKVQP